MSPIKRYAKKQAKARARRRHSAQERLERDQRQAQRAAEGLQQALEELGLPERSCTCTLRIITTGSPIDCHKSKKA